MSFQLPGTVQTNNPVLLHEWAGPFSGADETAALGVANAYIPPGVRLKGLEVTLIIGGVPAKYWYRTGTADGDLVPLVFDGALSIKDEGTVIDSSTSILNFTGGRIIATSPSAGSVSIEVGDCNNVIKISEMSGYFISAGDSTDRNHIAPLFIGNSNLGWSNGEYNSQCSSNSSGTIISIENLVRFCAIPLPSNLSTGDVVKICGKAFYDAQAVIETLPQDWNFYCSVAKIDCGKFSTSKTTEVNPFIPAIYTPFAYDGGTMYYTCFSGSVTLDESLTACDTSFLIGMQAGSKDGSAGRYYFTYSLDIIKSPTNF